MKATVLLLVVLSLSLALALNSLQASKDSSELPSSGITRLEKTIGADVIEILQHPDAVVVFSVEPNKAPKYYTPTSSEILLSIDLKIELQQLLLNDKHFVFGMNKRSPFLPSLGFKFSKKNGEGLTLLVSPTSNQIKILKGEAKFLLDYELSKEAANAFIKKIENLFTQ